MSAGKFRRDLYHRLTQLTVRMPLCANGGRRSRRWRSTSSWRVKENYRIQDNPMRALENWKWPGNVRELRNVVTNAAV